MLRLYDGSNYYRMALESDPTGLAPRSILNEITHHPDVHVWIFDGYQNNQRRRELFPDYKMKRKPAADSIYASMDLLRDVLKHSRAIQISVPGFEGDDVVATLAHQYAAQGVEVSIYSNDWDYAQLTVNPKIFCGARPKEGIEARYVRIYKATVGDPSDNIPGVAGFGVMTFMQADKDALIALAEGRSYNVDHCNLPPKIVNWLREPANLQQMKLFYQIVGFFSVPAELIEKHTIVGDGDYPKADALLRQFYQ